MVEKWYPRENHSQLFLFHFFCVSFSGPLFSAVKLFRDNLFACVFSLQNRKNMAKNEQCSLAHIKTAAQNEKQSLKGGGKLFGIWEYIHANSFRAIIQAHVSK